MPAAHQPSSLADRLRRFLAGSCAVLVLALSIFAASPVAHELLHTDDTDHSPVAEDGCAVDMFASGVALPVGPLAIIPPTAVSPGRSPVTAADVLLVSPRYLRQPERGPPVDLAR